MATGFADLKSEYAALWSSMEVRAERAPEVRAVARQIIANRPRYDDVSKATGVPWYVVGILHVMECDEFPKFTQHLHNGDSLNGRTWQIPAGRPKKGDGPFTWEESAIDALTMPGKQFEKITDWSIERIAHCFERYNGFGYRRPSINIHSPYLWSFTTCYKSGKYIRDKVWSAAAVSTQCGAMAILKALTELDSTIDLRAPDAMRKWPAAEVTVETVAAPSATEAVKVAASSRTIWSIVVAFFVAVGDFFKHGLDAVSRMFGSAPDIASEMQSMADPIRSVLDTLKINAGSISTAIVVACLAVAVVRHFDLKIGTGKDGE